MLRKLVRIVTPAGLSAACLLFPHAAVALALKTYVSATGLDSNSCVAGFPCQTLQQAHDRTEPGGQISCVDSLDVGSFTITKSITIDCSGTSSTFAGVNINTAGVVVTLRGLGQYLSGGVGIHFQNGAALILENCVVRNNPSFGIRFAPSSPGAQLTIIDTLIEENGTGATGSGIIVSPQGSGSAKVSVERVTLTKNVFGIAADGTGGTAGINMTIANSQITGNSQDGIIATTPSGGAPIGVLVTNTRSVNNTIGIRSLGPNVTVRVEGSKITGNGTGLAFGSGGALLTFGNNAVQANGTNGAFSGSVGLQ